MGQIFDQDSYDEGKAEGFTDGYAEGYEAATRNTLFAAEEDEALRMAHAESLDPNVAWIKAPSWAELIKLAIEYGKDSEFHNQNNF